jgi:hypothetical protein
MNLYDGYATLNKTNTNLTPLNVYDPAGDKAGITVNNKGEVKVYTNVGINESINEEKSMCEQCGGTMKENVCEQCGSMNEADMTIDTSNLYDVQDEFDKHVDYVTGEGETNEYYPVSPVEPAYNFQSGGPEDVYGTLKDYDKEHPHHDYDSMEDVEKWNPSDDLLRMFGKQTDSDSPSDTFQYDAGDKNRLGDAGLGQDTENDMDLSSVSTGYDFESGGAYGGGSFPNYGDEDDDLVEMEEELDEDLKESFNSNKKQILEMFQRMNRF